MTKEELIEIIVSWENLPLIIHGFKNHPENFSVLAQVAMQSNHPKSWRAAWLMDKIHEKNPGLVTPFIPDMIEKIKTEDSDGKKRHFLKLISLNNIPSEHQGFLFDYCLKAFTSAKEPLAVRVHAMQILYQISENEPELKHEILAIIEDEMENHSSAGIISRGRKLAWKLKEQIRIKD